jgi:hypothetical protein
MAVLTGSRKPIIDSLVIVITLLCIGIGIGFLRKKLHNLSGIVSFSLLFSGIICMNQHVISGIYVQPHGHYDRHVLPQSLILAIVLLVAEYMKKGGLTTFSTHRRFKQYFLLALILFGGIGLISAGLFLTPELVQNRFSSDGILSPEFLVFLKNIRAISVILGTVLLLGVVFQKSYRRFQNFFTRLSRMSQPLQTYSKTMKTIIAACLLAYCIYDVSLLQLQAYQKHLKPEYGYLQEYAPALSWLREQTPKESVLLTSLDYLLTSTISIYTDNNVYLSVYARFYTIPSLDELKDRLYNLMSFMGISSRETFDEFLHDPVNFPDILRDYFSPSFQEFQQKLKKDLYQELRKYRVDYVFYSLKDQERFYADLTKYPFLKEVYKDNAVIIYQVL